VKSLIAVEEALNPVLASGDFSQAEKRITEGPAVDYRLLARLEPVNVGPKNELRFRTIVDLESRLARAVIGDHEKHAAVKSILASRRRERDG
jgi:hypothetical protein